LPFLAPFQSFAPVVIPAKDIVGWASAHQFPYKNQRLSATLYGGLIGLLIFYFGLMLHAIRTLVPSAVEGTHGAFFHRLKYASFSGSGILLPSLSSPFVIASEAQPSEAIS
jgi:hypothetical protein